MKKTSSKFKFRSFAACERLFNNSSKTHDKEKGFLNLLLITCFLFATSCTTTWSHNTKSSQDFYKDHTNCQAKAGDACGHGDYSHHCKKNVISSCLTGEGWYEVKN